jgi:hypothetical protein
MALAPAHAPSRRPSGRPSPRSAPRRPPLRVFEPTPRRPLRLRAPQRPHLWVSATLVVGSLLAVVVGDAMVTQSTVRLSHLQAQVDAAAATQKALDSSVAQLAAPTRIVARAIQLGMTAPAQVVDLPQVPLDVPLPEPVIAAAPTAPAATAVAPARSAAVPATASAPTRGATTSAAPAPTTTAPPSSGAGAAGAPAPTSAAASAAAAPGR